MHFMHGIFTKLMPELGPGVDDNHWVPQHCFIDKNTYVFKYEKIHEAMDFLLQKKVITANSILPHTNKSKSSDNLSKPDWNYAPGVTKYFYKLYEKDFKMFDYDVPEEILKHA